MEYLKVAEDFPEEWSPEIRYPLAATAVLLNKCDGTTAVGALAALARVLEIDTDTLIQHLRDGDE